MPEPRRPSRMQSLVAEARKALDLRDRLLADGDGVAEVVEALDGLYRDIGELLVATVNAGGMIPEPPPGLHEGFTDELPDYEAEDPGSWYTDEKEIERGPSQDKPKIFDDGDLDLSTDVPESAPSLPPEPLSFDDTDPTGTSFQIETLETMAARAREDLGSGLAQLALHGASTPWRPQLDELLELLVLPADFDDPKELSVEASRVQWAANEIEYRLRGYPDDVRICLVGLLAARAQHLRTKLDVDVGLRVSLDHLQRYRIDEDLPSVAGLLPTPGPERGAWPQDVRAWWSLLRPKS